jgi:hypothetical protein
MTAYINSPGHEVPSNTILAIPHTLDLESHYLDVVEPLVGKIKREWFNDHFYYCLPLVIGNQQGFVVKSSRRFEVEWAGGEAGVRIDFLDGGSNDKQVISDHFKCGIITVQNRFAMKTPPGINLMTMQPPNFYIDGLMAMTAVVEADNIRRDFTFNIKMTRPNHCVIVEIGDPLAAFIPIPRGTVENYEMKLVTDFFSREQHSLEIDESNLMGEERRTVDVSKPHGSGRRYFKGVHSNGDVYTDHQKTLKGNDLTL